MAGAEEEEEEGRRNVRHSPEMAGAEEVEGDSPEMAGEGRNGVDLFQKLTEDILIKIVSHLTSPKAAFASILSKRWKDLYKKTYCIKFDEETDSYRVMMKHLVGREKIKKCILVLKDNFSKIDTASAMTLLNTIFETHREIEFLSIETIKWFFLPESVCKLSYLVELGLNCVSIGFVTAKNVFPCLKILSLERIIFSEKGKLLSFLHCSDIVQELKIDWVDYKFSSNKEPPFGSFPKLLKVVLHGEWQCFLDMSSMVTAHMLKAHLFLVQPGGHPIGHPLNTEFLNLTELSLSISNAYIGWVARFLSCCPLLYSLEIEFGLGLQNHIEDKKVECGNEEDLLPKFGLGYVEKEKVGEEFEWKKPLEVPTCFSSSLKKLCFKKFGGKSMEMNLAQYIMNNSSNLETVNIQILPSLTDRVKNILVHHLTKSYGHKFPFNCSV